MKRNVERSPNKLIIYLNISNNIFIEPAVLGVVKIVDKNIIKWVEAIEYKNMFIII